MELEHDSKPFTLDIGDFSGDNKLDMAPGNCGQYSFTNMLINYFVYRNYKNESLIF